MKKSAQTRMQLLLALLVFSIGSFAQNVVPDDGNGGPVLLVTNTANPFSKFPVEILRAEGWNAYKSIDISAVTATELNKYDVVIIGDIPVTSTQAALFDSWTTINGGTLIAFSPDPNLYSLLGITATGGTLADKYIKINNSSAPGAGLVSQTIQYHGSADLFTLNAGTISIATIYSTANTATTYPAVTLRNVTNGGQAIAFTYDLARSIVYTRQGNPAWSGQERDGEAPIRSDDLFFGASATDPQPDYVDLNKVAIPQADEQMRLLSNLMLIGSFDKKPLPRVWFLPKGKKAAIVMTGDDHGRGGTVGRFNQYMTLGPNTAQDVADWNAIRGTSYIYSGSLTNAQVISFQNAGFEMGLHLNVNEGSNFTDAQWNSFWDSQMGTLISELPNMSNQLTLRTHFISWGPWANQAKLEVAKGVRMDVNYYYYPANWVAERPGMFTGSGMPMRFADLDGTLINSYQVPTQLPDESLWDVSMHVNSLLDSALGTAGYYGVFCANNHTDFTTSTDPGQINSDKVIASAIARQVPVVSAKQMLDWIDGRNNAYFSNIVWNNNQLAFTLSADSRARNMKLMLPGNTGLSTFQSITKDGATVPFTMQVIKGVQYAFFDGTSGNYVATYSAIVADITPPAISNVQASTTSQGSAIITWTTDEMSDSRVDYGIDAVTISSNLSDATLTTSHSVTIEGLVPLTTYYFRVTSKDVANNSRTAPATPAAPLQFVMPATTVCAADNLSADFALGTPDANISIISTGNGELSLKQNLKEEQFTATSLPAGWNSGPTWTGSGTVGFAGGFANVDGSRLYTTTAYQQGAAAEFSARFSQSDYENIGYSQDNNFNPYWITVGRGSVGTATDVYVRTSDGVAVSLGTNLINAYHTYRIAWGVSAFTIFVDGVSKATVNKTTTAPMIFIVSDYAVDANNISVDFFREITGGYAASGTYISRVFSLGSTPGTTSISWNATIPANTGLSISMRSGNSVTPDGTWSAFANVANNQILSLSGTNVQYQAILTTQNSANTSLLNSITFTCANPQQPAPPVISAIQSVPSVNGRSVITWTTDLLSDSRIDYGTSPASLSNVVNDAAQVTAHSITLTGLQPVTYYYRVSSKFGTSLQTTSPAAPAAPLQFTIPINTICASDDLASDFALGATGTNTMVTSTVNGEVALSQSFTEEAFTATTIPSGWNFGVWDPAGSATYNGGIATVNAGKLYTTQTFGPGTSVEFSARFTLSDFQNIGFAANNNFDPYWATIGRGAEGSLTDVYFRTSDNVKISLGTGYLDAFHTYKITWSPTSFTVYVDGVQKATVNVSQATPLIFAVSDLINDANSLSIDYFRILNSGYVSSGTYTSRVFSLGSYSGTTVVSWNESVPANTGLAISVRSGNTTTPDGSWTAFTPISNGQAVTPSGSFVQYQAILTTSNSANTPLLNNITFDCVNTQPQVPPVISNVQAAPSLNGTSVVTWTTDVVSDSRIDYGTSAASLSNVVNDVAQVTSHSITLPGLTFGTTYYYTVTSKYGASLPATFPAAPASPLSFTMPVLPPVVTVQPSNAVTCLNSVITMTSAATGAPSPTVQWQESTNGTTWTNITGATNSTLSFTPLQTDNGKSYRASWANTGGTVSSNSALLTVNPLPNGTLTSGTACYSQPAQLTFTSTAGTAPYSLVVSGTTYNNVQSGTSFVTTTTATPPAPSQIQLWANTVTPGTPNFTETSAIEVGTKVRVTTAGTVSALRFYKGNRTDAATYRLRLYNNATKRIMAEVTYSNNNFVGWVTVNLPAPVALATDSLYVVTYYSPNRFIARQNSIFTNNLTRTPLIGVGTSTIYGPNGVYIYGGGFPTSTVAGRGYFADLVFNYTAAPTPIAFNLTRITDAKGCVLTVNQTLNVTPASCAPAAPSKSSATDNSINRTALSIVENFSLEQNRPNPFNNTTTISYTIPKQVHVTLTVYDLQGRIISVFDEGQRKAGKYMLNIDSKNMNKGIYMYRLQAGEFSATKKMILE